MALQFFQDSPEVAFRKVIDDLSTMNPKMHQSVFEDLSITQIDNMLDDLARREKKFVHECFPYGSWLIHPGYVQVKMLQEGLKNLREHREDLEETEILVPGFIYYRGVRQFGPRVEGQTCMYLGEERPANWINFIDISPVMKVMEVLRHGDNEDFRRLYVEMANGRADGLNEVSVQHITESSDDALRAMEAYCDVRWEGPWPWDISAPYKLNRLVEEKTTMRNSTINEMHYMFQQLLEMAEQGGAERFEIIAYSRDLSDQIQGIIEKFAKIAGESIISFKSQVLTAMGDEAAMKVEHGITAPINQVADALSRLKANIDTLIGQLEDHQPSDLDMGAAGGGGMGDMGGMGSGDMGPTDMSGNDMGQPDMAGGEAPPGGQMPPGGGQPDMGGGAMPPGGNISPERPKKGM